MHKDTEQPALLLIAGLHPQVLEKGVSWFEKNQRDLLRAVHVNPFWKHNLIVLEPDKQIKISELVRNLTDMGYVKTGFLAHPGEFVQLGGELTIFPINTREPYRIEFFGNRIESIQPTAVLSDAREIDEVQKRFLETQGLAMLRPGDFVVHVDHGIGIFRGIEERNDVRYILLEYAGPARHASPTSNALHSNAGGPRKDTPPDTLLVPEDVAKKISLYIGFRTPTVHRLGTPTWNNIKRKAKEDIIKFAKELLEVYAKREVAERLPYEPTPAYEDELAASFIHEETPDQTKAVAEVLSDMAQPRPMDRLLLADVGFGKTEVAVRAAFRAVLNKRQVALLCPTTILTDQHFETFTERLDKLGVAIARLSRLEALAKQKQILHRLGEGKIDIIIGTHRLLSRDVTFQNLGLLIVDEEQRFGVRQKEHIRKMKENIDTLSLSATPIPRTLNFSLSGLKPMSVISTPPKNRIAPKTFVLPFSKQTVKNAIAAELERRGQIYFLCNHIRKMPMMREYIHKIAPKARIATIHGRMGEESLIKAMHEFREHKTDMLLATTIIENGLDISNANTLIVEDASLIGLSQAHQLRGRIGRGTVQSYAYFLYPSHKLKEKAERRLDALFRAQYLGAGQDIALRDLEIRGTGNILGREQSGRINQIGLNLYCQMLSEAVEQFRD